MPITDQDLHGIREHGRKDKDLETALTLLGDLDADTLVDMVALGEAIWVRRSWKSYGAAGFRFSREDLRVLYRAVVHLAGHKCQQQKAMDDEIDRICRTNRTPDEQRKDTDRARKANKPVIWH